MKYIRIILGTLSIVIALTVCVFAIAQYSGNLSMNETVNTALVELITTIAFSVVLLISGVLFIMRRKLASVFGYAAFFCFLMNTLISVNQRFSVFFILLNVLAFLIEAVKIILIRKGSVNG